MSKDSQSRLGSVETLGIRLTSSVTRIDFTRIYKMKDMIYCIFYARTLIVSIEKIRQFLESFEQAPLSLKQVHSPSHQSYRTIQSKKYKDRLCVSCVFMVSAGYKAKEFLAANI